MAFGPVIGLFLIIRVIPLVWVLSLSFTNYSLRRPTTKFVGLENFSRMLDDPRVALGFKNTMQFVVVSVPAVIILGLFFALLMNRKLKFEGLYQALFFLPFILSTVPTSIIWRWIYAPGRWGLANYLLESVGLTRVKWLTDPQIAIMAIILIYVWKNLGYYVVVFLVGLKNVPSELREAAEVDGASVWQTTRHIDLPLMRPLILFGTVYATIAAMAVFTIVYVISQGTDVSAGVDITVLAMNIYQEGFAYDNKGYASAIALVLFVVSLGAVLIQFKLFGTETE
jgi:ABC-type sugar transport system permease subunit